MLIFLRVDVYSLGATDHSAMSGAVFPDSENHSSSCWGYHTRCYIYQNFHIALPVDNFPIDADSVPTDHNKSIETALAERGWVARDVPHSTRSSVVCILLLVHADCYDEVEGY